MITHNKYRSKHLNTNPLVYDDQLGRDAQKYAEHLARTKTFEHAKERNGAGENLYVSSSSSTDLTKAAISGITAW